MFIRMLKIVLPCTIIAVAAVAAAVPHIQNDIVYRWLLPKSRFVSITPQHSGHLAKTSSTAWKRVGGTYYSNIASSGSPVQWSFSSRDTMAYDAAGNLILHKTTLAKSGWETDSVQFVDSMIYRGGQLIESINMWYPNVGLIDTDTIYGSRDIIGGRVTYSYLDGGKVYVETHYDLSSIKSWIPWQKDSLVFSAPFIYDGSGLQDLSRIIGDYSFYYYDTVNSTWECSTALTKVNAECDSMRLVLQGRGTHFIRNGQDTVNLADVKDIFTFSSSNWSNQTLIETRHQEKDPVTGIYIDANIFTMSPFYEEFDEWDTTGNGLVCLYKYYRDSHGNDTFQFYRPNAQRDPQEWYNTRWLRTYDVHGNNVVTITSSSSIGDDKTWETTTKDTNYFAQVAVPIFSQPQAPSLQKASMAFSPGMVRFSGQGITVVNLYNAVAGRMVTSVKHRLRRRFGYAYRMLKASHPAGSVCCRTGM